MIATDPECAAHGATQLVKETKNINFSGYSWRHPSEVFTVKPLSLPLKQS